MAEAVAFHPVIIIDEGVNLARETAVNRDAQTGDGKAEARAEIGCELCNRTKSALWRIRRRQIEAVGKVDQIEPVAFLQRVQEAIGGIADADVERGAEPALKHKGEGADGDRENERGLLSVQRQFRRLKFDQADRATQETGQQDLANRLNGAVFEKGNAKAHFRQTVERIVQHIAKGVQLGETAAVAAAEVKDVLDQLTGLAKRQRRNRLIRQRDAGQIKPVCVRKIAQPIDQLQSVQNIKNRLDEPEIAALTVERQQIDQRDAVFAIFIERWQKL